MFWKPEYALLMLFSTAITFFCGRAITTATSQLRRKLILTSCLVVNLLLLFFFKYFNFFSDLIRSVLGIGAENWLYINVLLPVGISFYVFQALGYLIDVYRDSNELESNFISYALFVSFFPQLVAGPIERSKNILPQLKQRRTFDKSQFCAVMPLMLWGFFKKLVIADNLATVVNTVYAAPASYNGWQLIVATAAFAIQIYCDFSAYSDIARASAKLLGVELMINFKSPYFSKSITEFWRRWHISLTSFFRDYLYIPLGGSHKGALIKYRNILITFLLSGLWHGASLTFVVWGLLNGIYQLLEDMAKTLWRRAALKPIKLPVLFKMLYTFTLACSTWVFFRAESLSQAMFIVKRVLLTIFAPHRVLIDSTRLNISSVEIIFLMVWVAVLFLGEWFDYQKLCERSMAVRYVFYAMLTIAILTFGAYGVGYDPIDFVYFRF